jgi:hypothetical protein
MVLKMTLKKKWFDMILSGEKKTEYRELKPYWIKRIFDYKDLGNGTAESFLDALMQKKYPMFFYQKRITQIHFFNGAYFSENLPNFVIELESTYFGEGVEEWGAEKGKEYLSFRLGKIVSKCNCP